VYRQYYLISLGAGRAGNTVGMSRQLVYYYQRKREDPTFHPGMWGGKRWSRLTEEEFVILETVVLACLLQNPTSTYKSLRLHIQREYHEFGKEISEHQIRSVYKRWKWTWKIPVVIQVR
jgi:transposase